MKVEASRVLTQDPRRLGGRVLHSRLYCLLLKYPLHRDIARNLIGGIC